MPTLPLLRILGSSWEIQKPGTRTRIPCIPSRRSRRRLRTCIQCGKHLSKLRRSLSELRPVSTRQERGIRLRAAPRPRSCCFRWSSPACRRRPPHSCFCKAPARLDREACRQSSSTPRPARIAGARFHPGYPGYYPDRSGRRAPATSCRHPARTSRCPSDSSSLGCSSPEARTVPATSSSRKPPSVFSQHHAFRHSSASSTSILSSSGSTTSPHSRQSRSNLPIGAPHLPHRSSTRTPVGLVLSGTRFNVRPLIARTPLPSCSPDARAEGRSRAPAICPCAARSGCGAARTRARSRPSSRPSVGPTARSRRRAARTCGSRTPAGRACPW